MEIALPEGLLEMVARRASVSAPAGTTGMSIFTALTSKTACTSTTRWKSDGDRPARGIARDGCPTGFSISSGRNYGNVDLHGSDLQDGLHINDTLEVRWRSPCPRDCSRWLPDGLQYQLRPELRECRSSRL